ncbi:response regulator [Roseixanthobacter glucoisosaccharinicivorans]|uniref:response regulator n=1 Tax=Roseixanthobacter glucoisosaccharinicivorans TaxID=3119923 RepID=UPI00372822A5
MPRTILVVEDEPLVRLVIAEALRDQGFRVVEAASADEAILALSAGLAVDLVFTDVRMPGAVDGLALASRLKRERPELPVLITSGHLERLEGADTTAFIPKPYVLGEAVARIAALLDPSSKENI